MNGPLSGKDVFVPMECLLGGQERAGYGWNMLMECLAEGRGISLPALSVGAAQMAVNAVGAYARIRKQFKVPIAELEGVQEQLAAIASTTYRMNACQYLMNGARARAAPRGAAPRPCRAPPRPRALAPRQCRAAHRARAAPRTTPLGQTLMLRAH